jgi:hypothetical protein
MNKYSQNENKSFMNNGYSKHLQILLEMNQRNKCKNLVQRLLKINSENKAKHANQHFSNN